MTTNPFYITTLNEFQRPLLYSQFLRVLIICSKKNKLRKFIYKKKLNNKDINKFKKDFTIIETNIKIINNNIFYNKLLIINSDFLKSIRKDNYLDEELVLPLFELHIDTINKIISNYNNAIDMETFKKSIGIMHYYYRTSPYDKTKYFMNLVKNLNIEQNNNLNLSLDNFFVKRIFKTNIKTLNDYQFKNITILKEHDYVDINKVFREKKYYYNKNINLNKNEINNMIELLNEYELYTLFNTLICSRDYCHLILNNSYILQKCKNLFDKYNSLYSYIIGYAWTKFYIEECINKLDTTSNCVFDIETASHLPFYPIDHTNIHSNPYVTLFLSEKQINSSKNLMSIEHNSKIVTLDKFKRNLNTFISNDENIDLLDGINLNLCAITGSIIPACSLDDFILCKLEGSYANYINKYYKESDIDVMCKFDSIFEFIRYVNDFSIKIKENIKKYRNEDTNFNIIPDRKLIFLVNESFIKEHIEEINNYCEDKFNSKDIITHFDSQLIKEYFYNTYYINFKKEQNKKMRKNYNSELCYSYMTFFDMEKIDIKLVTYDSPKEMIKLYENELVFFDKNNKFSMKMAESVKFKIHYDVLKHEFELFNVKTNTFINKIKKFHLPLVRGYYNDNVYFCPSAITALTTGINIEYKYIVGAKDPVDILNKYRMRGFSTILNNHELMLVKKYNETNDKNGGIFKNSSFGTMQVDNKIFGKTFGVIKSPVKINNIINFIDKNGNLEPLHEWIFDAMYNGKFLLTNKEK